MVATKRTMLPLGDASAAARGRPRYRDGTFLDIGAGWTGSTEFHHPGAAQSDERAAREVLAAGL